MRISLISVALVISISGASAQNISDDDKANDGLAELIKLFGKMNADGSPIQAEGDLNDVSALPRLSEPDTDSAKTTVSAQDNTPVTARADIIAAQRALSSYDAGEADGVWGWKSQAALDAYIKDWRLPPSPDGLTVALLAHVRGETPDRIAQWLDTDQPNCRVWNPSPAAQVSATWSGDCKNRHAQGQGELTWQYVIKGNDQTDSYVGGYSKGRRHGDGVYTTQGGYRYEGGWVEDERSGRSTAIYTNGDRYEGEFLKDERYGRGVYTTQGGYRYEGGWVEDERSGRSTAIYTNGNRYEGEFLKGELHGRGVYTTPDSYRYEGGYVEGMRSGRSSEIYTNGDRYEGEFLKDERHGRGVYTTPDGYRYEGGYVEGKRSGFGVAVFSDGARYEGQWRNGDRQGAGYMKFASGETFSGEWRTDKPNGQGSYFAADGEVYAGNWTNGCFRRADGSWAAVSTTRIECGF